MHSKEIKCPHCGETIDLVKELKSDSIKTKSSKNIFIGALTGLFIGLIFDYFYFYIGVITDYFTFMPIVHLIAGTLLGMLVGWIIGEKKKLKSLP